MLTRFAYSRELCERFPQLQCLVTFIDGLDALPDVTPTVDTHLQAARESLLKHGSESQMAPIQAWRVAYRATATDPTKFRMAAESILRRLRTSGDFTRSLHPLVVVCNALSARFAMPIAALDCDRIDAALEVRITTEAARYEAFDGTVSTLTPGEVSFVDASGQAHARKWSHKQSARSAVSATTRSAFVVAEGLHSGAEHDLDDIEQHLTQAVRTHWPAAGIRVHRIAGTRLTEGVAAMPAAFISSPP
jgi:DNA/RNA-binding domain of Phe-tRNA-synthetase-like protein